MNEESAGSYPRVLKPYINTQYKIIYEDEYFYAVDKPSPLPVHPVGRFKEDNLLKLLERDKQEKGLSIVNRLDSETSGLVIVARSGEVSGKLGRIFENREVTKEYRAVVFGVPKEDKGSIEISLGTTQKGIQNIRVPDPNGQTARTDYEVLSKSPRYSLLKIIPLTGRTHQIRAHMAFSGHPAVGDKIYIDSNVFERYIREGWQEDMRSVIGAERLLLHAARLEFPHPINQKRISLTCGLPDCFTAFIKD